MRKRNGEAEELQAATSLGQGADRQAQLIEAARVGDAAAWQEIYHGYFRRMYTYAYCRIGDSAAAEDIAAQVFLEAWKRIKSFQYRGVPISAWLYRIAHDLSADFLRRRNRIKFESLDGRGGEPRLAGGGHEEAIVNRQWVVSALQRLTAEQQQVVVMRFVEGHSLAAVSGATGKSEEAVKALQHRALRSLRRRLEKTRSGEET